MSARDRAEKNAKQRDQRFWAAAKEGMRQAMESPDGRAMVWAIYSENADAEGKGSKGRRIIARDLLRAASLANWLGVQIMREEWEQPRLGVAQEADPEEGDE